MKEIKRCSSGRAFSKIRCKCGVDICFYNDYSAICSYCGRKIYPSRKCEFREKMKKEIKKHEQSIINWCNY